MALTQGKISVRCPFDGCGRALQTRELKDHVDGKVYAQLLESLRVAEEEHDVAEIAAALGGMDMQLRHCPKCRVLIEKNRGCSSMRCYRCDHNFTWSNAALPGQGDGDAHAQRAQARRLPAGGWRDVLDWDPAGLRGHRLSSAPLAVARLLAARHRVRAFVDVEFVARYRVNPGHACGWAAGCVGTWFLLAYFLWEAVKLVFTLPCMAVVFVAGWLCNMLGLLVVGAVHFLPVLIRHWTRTIFAVEAAGCALLAWIWFATWPAKCAQHWRRVRARAGVGDRPRLVVVFQLLLHSWRQDHDPIGNLICTIGSIFLVLKCCLLISAVGDRCYETTATASWLTDCTGFASSECGFTCVGENCAISSAAFSWFSAIPDGVNQTWDAHASQCHDGYHPRLPWSGNQWLPCASLSPPGYVVNDETGRCVGQPIHAGIIGSSYWFVLLWVIGVVFCVCMNV